MLRSIFHFAIFLNFFVFFVFFADSSEAEDRERSHRVLELKLAAIETRIDGILSKLNRLERQNCKKNEELERPEADS